MDLFSSELKIMELILCVCVVTEETRGCEYIHTVGLTVAQ